jgi:DNA-binding transcriptional ArsR family regulator
MEHDPYDLKHLRVDIEPTAHKPARRKTWRRHYVRVPWVWVERLRSAKRVSTYQLAHVLLYEHWRTGGKPIALSNITMQSEGITPRSKSNALDELTELGLITVERKPRRAPRVTLLQVSDA